MPVTSYLIGVAITTILTAVAWVLVLLYFDPTIVGAVGLTLFLMSLGLSLIGGLTLALYALYFKLTNPARFWLALRHGGLLGLAAIVALLLQWWHVLSWWNILMILVAVVLLEVYLRIKVE